MGNRMGRATALLSKLLSLLLDISAPLVAEGSKKFLDVIIRGAYLIRSHIFWIRKWGGGEMARFWHVPNEETARVLKETDLGESLVEYETMDEFWDSLGFSRHA